MNKSDNIQLKAARLLQHDVEIVKNPFQEMALKLDIEEAQFLRIIKKLRSDGLMRKFGAILRHNKVGYKKNALIIWSVPPQLTEKAGNIFSAFSFVSHCYERKPAFKIKYNLFTMVHSQSENIENLISAMSESSGISDFMVLESLQEYKKTSPEYF
ncbi:MAG TPA: Lrp/AsnC family transcriptional regulator [Deltaproteobacteria bacterium]|nr:Lrp/AsnC family transcriptional regulator [Deltaproteobacteria bacterium]